MPHQVGPAQDGSLSIPLEEIMPFLSHVIHSFPFCFEIMNEIGHRKALIIEKVLLHPI